MASTKASDAPVIASSPAQPSPGAGFTPVTAAIAVMLVLLGALSLHVQLEGLWRAWTTSPLRQVGMLIPPVALWLAWRSWSKADWAGGGTWWGLLPLTAALALGLVQSAGAITLTFGIVVLGLVPIGLIVFLYVSGVVLLLGGTRTWRKAAFAICLLLLLNPVPGAFEQLVDLPLQTIGARVARGFANLISVPVTGEALRLMFTPQLGIFIAPGCNGMHGSTTMGLLALVGGHLYRMKWPAHAAFVVAAVVLAYIFNLVRLCGVVGYYWFAVRVPALGNHGELVDYLIGGALFLFAAWFLFRLPRRIGARA